MRRIILTSCRVQTPVCFSAQKKNVFVSSNFSKVFFSAEKDKTAASAFHRIVGHLGDSTMLSAEREDDLVPMHKKYEGQLLKVKRILNESGKFSRDVIDSEALYYYNNLGLNEYYFQTATPHIIANNLRCVIAAKIMNEVSSSSYFPEIHQESADEIFWMAHASLMNRRNSQNYLVEKKLESKYLAFDGAEGKIPLRLQGYRSVGPLFQGPDTEDRLRTYFLQKPQYPTPMSEISSTELDMNKILDVYFAAHKKGTATESIFDALNKKVCEDQTGAKIFINAEPRLNGTIWRLDFAFRRQPDCLDFFSTLGDTITMWGLYSQRKYVEPLGNGVTIVTTFNKEVPSELPEFTLEAKIERLVRAVKMQYIMPRSAFMDLALDRLLSVYEAAYTHCVAKFIFQFSGTVGPAFTKVSQVLEGSTEVSDQDLYEIRTRLKVPPFSEDTILQVIQENPRILKRLYHEFQEMHHPSYYRRRGSKHMDWLEDTPLSQDIDRLGSDEATKVFKLFRIFNKHIKVTNFWRSDKAAISFRFSTEFLSQIDYPDTPYAVLFVCGQGFTGFHVRFAEVARGGIRVVQSLSQQAYDHNRQHAFDEVYKLSRTQNFKNKDIPEGGSKGIVLLDYTQTKKDAEEKTPTAFKRYIDAFLDILLPDERTISRLKENEICFLGPDEHTGTGGLMDWAALMARSRGAWFWKAFTTGKQAALGGIPHDTYGMTTTSVETFIKGILEKHGLNEGDITKCQTGGPDGDLGSNSILMSDTKTTSIVDGSGVIHDPNGLDKTELRRLASTRFKGEPSVIMDFNATLLSPKGFKVSVTDKDITLPDGTLVPSGLPFRNEFHLNPLAKADLFNPCGGRPESITPFNVHSLFNEKGEPLYRFICEGANVFIMENARRYLEQRGIVLFKDASANKGGVTSSSLEVLAALALNEDEFEKHMSVNDQNNPPNFYQEYITHVKSKISENAKLEFEALWNEGLRTGRPRCELTDALSGKIIDMKTEILNSKNLYDDLQLRELTLKSAIPPVLMPQLVSLKTLEERVPETYLKALFSSFLASRFYYLYGINANPFHFFDFIGSVKADTKFFSQPCPK